MDTPEGLQSNTITFSSYDLGSGELRVVRREALVAGSQLDAGGQRRHDRRQQHGGEDDGDGRGPDETGETVNDPIHGDSPQKRPKLAGTADTAYAVRELPRSVAPRRTVRTFTGGGAHRLPPGGYPLSRARAWHARRGQPLTARQATTARGLR
jgi:hypothetical protein